ncbi:MAG: hypothetical protein AB7F25_02800 [Deferribacterales bacterium]
MNMSVDTFILGTIGIILTVSVIGVVAMAYLDEKEKKLKLKRH